MRPTSYQDATRMCSLSVGLPQPHCSHNTIQYSTHAKNLDSTTPVCDWELRIFVWMDYLETHMDELSREEGIMPPPGFLAASLVMAVAGSSVPPRAHPLSVVRFESKRWHFWQR